MKKNSFSLIFLLPISAMASGTDEVNANSNEVKQYDSTKYCYYADNKFSEGARYKQADEFKVCTRKSDNTLFWKSL